MSNYNTAPVEVLPATSFDFSQWEVAQSQPCPSSDVNYKTANPELHGDGEYQEYRTKYHGYSLERLEKLEKKRPQLYQDGDLLFASPNSRR